MRRPILFLILLLLPALTLGQVQTTGQIAGKITDEEGHPIAGALVVVHSPSLQGELKSKTNDQGDFLFSVLPVGSYQVTISASGRKTLDYTFRLGLGQTVPLDVTLPAGEELVERVTVYAPPTIMETTAGGENFHMDTQIEEMPIADRLIEVIANNAPNVVPLQECESCWMQMAGSMHYENAVLLDGAEISDEGIADAFYIPDALEEVEVETTGLSARYGRFSGGVMNAVTKTGGNDVSATARIEYTKQSWNSTTPLEEEQSDDLNWQVTATAGGFFKKDRLWYFLAGLYEPDTKASFTAATQETVVQTIEEDRIQAKLRGSAGANHVIDANFYDQESFRDNIPAWIGEARTASQSRRERRLMMLGYRGVLGPSSFVDVQVTEKQHDRHVGGDPSGGSVFIHIGAGPNNIFNNAQGNRDELLEWDNRTASMNLTHLVGTKRWGTHTLETGVQWVESKTGGDYVDSPSGYTLLSLAPDFVIRDAQGIPIIHPDGRVHFNLYPTMFGRWKDLGLGTSAKIDYLAAYVQDSWTRGPWRVDAGLRLEAYEGDSSVGLRTVDFHDLSPRLGVTYNLAQNWQIQASWGKYLARFSDDVANTVTGVLHAPRVVHYFYFGPALLDVTADALEDAIQDDANWGPIVQYRDPSFPTTVLSSDLESPYAVDLNLALKHALPRGRGTLEARYTHRNFRRNIDDFVGGDHLNVVSIDPDSDGWPIELDQYVYGNNPDARREYDAFALVWNYRPGVKWNIAGNYTWSRLEGNFDKGSWSGADSGTNLGYYPNCLPPDAAFASGRLEGDVTHVVRTWGNYRFDFGRMGLLSLGGLFRYRSGDVWNRAEWADIWIDDPGAVGDLGNYYLHHFEPLGANRFPSTWALDFSARYQIPVAKKLDAWVKVNVLNVLNRDEVFYYNTDGNVMTQIGDLYDVDGNLVLDGGGNPIPVPIPTGWEPADGFGQPQTQDDYQTPRSYLVTLGLAW